MQPYTHSHWHLPTQSTLVSPTLHSTIQPNLITLHPKPTQGLTEFSQNKIMEFDKNSIPNEEHCAPNTKFCVSTIECCAWTEFLPKKSVYPYPNGPRTDPQP